MSTRSTRTFLFALSFFLAFRSESYAERWVQENAAENVLLVYDQDTAPPLKIREIKEALPRITQDLRPLFGNFLSDGLVLVLDTRPKSHNGLATVVPSDRVIIHAAPPHLLDSIGEARNYIHETTLHELTHIAQLGLRRGWMKALSYVFGTIVAPNSTFPIWFIEGLAVLHETKFSRGGRGRSSFVRMILQEACREKLFDNPQFAALDQLSSPTYPWPLGMRPYLIGYDFLNFVETKVGAEKLNQLHHQSAGWVPYFWLLYSDGVLGHTWTDLWKAYVQQRQQECPALPASSIKSESTQLGYQTWGPLPTERGTFFFHSSFDTRGHLMLWKINEADPLPLKKMTPLATSDFRHLAWNSKEQELLYGFTEQIPWKIGEQRRIGAVRVNSDDSLGKTRKLTTEDSADPDLRARDNLLVYVHQSSRQGNGLRLLSSGEKPKWACPPMRDVEFFQPRFHPTKNVILVTAHPWDHPHQVWECQLKSGKWARLLSAEHSGYYFSGFAPGLTFVTEMAEKKEPVTKAILEKNFHLCQVPSLPSSLRFQTTWADQRVYGVSYSNRGFDLTRARAPQFDAAQCVPAKPVALSWKERPARTVQAETAESYNPWPHLLPRFWVPTMNISADIISLGAATAQWDPLYRHQYLLSASYDVQPNLPAGALQYTYKPGFIFSSITGLFALNDPIFVASVLMFQPVLAAFQQFQFSLDSEAAWTGRFGFMSEHRLSRDALQPSRANAFVFSVSTQDTEDVAAAPDWNGYQWTGSHELFHSYWGSNDNFLRLRSSFRWNWELPYSSRHLLKIGFDNSYSRSLDDQTVPVGYRFSAGSPYNLSFNIRPSTFLMRGYGPGFFRSPQLHLAHAGYEISLFRVYRGMGLFPLFLKNITLEATTDWLTGSFPGHSLWQNWFASAGGELKFHFTSFYAIPTTLMTGVYYGFDFGGGFQWQVLLELPFF